MKNEKTTIIRRSNKPKIYEDQTLLEQFTAPEIDRLVKVYKSYLEQMKAKKVYLAESLNIMAKNG